MCILRSSTQDKPKCISVESNVYAFWQYPNLLIDKNISMAYFKTVVTPLLTHWSYSSLALSHRFPSTTTPCLSLYYYEKDYVYSCDLFPYVREGVLIHPHWVHDYLWVPLWVYVQSIKIKPTNM